MPTFVSIAVVLGKLSNGDACVLPGHGSQCGHVNQLPPILQTSWEVCPCQDVLIKLGVDVHLALVTVGN